MKSFFQTLVGAVMVGVAIFSPFLVAQSQSPVVPPAQVEAAKPPVLTAEQKLKMVEAITEADKKRLAATPEELGKAIAALIAKAQTDYDNSMKDLNNVYQSVQVPGWQLTIQSTDSRTWIYTPAIKK